MLDILADEHRQLADLAAQLAGAVEHPTAPDPARGAFGALPVGRRPGHIQVRRSPRPGTGSSSRSWAWSTRYGTWRPAAPPTPGVPAVRQLPAPDERTGILRRSPREARGKIATSGPDRAVGLHNQ